MMDKKETLSQTLPMAALVIGASSAIAKSLAARLSAHNDIQHVVTVSRNPWMGEALTQHQHYLSDYSDDSIGAIVDNMATRWNLRFVVICNGILHQEKDIEQAEVWPEKRIESFSANTFTRTLNANTLTPMLWLSTLSPVLAKQDKTLPVHIAVFSARVGSIGDNHLGGWYSYRASKAALNMLLKTSAVEMARRLPQVKLISFHPGTTDTPLSRPFQQRVPESKLFTPEFVAERLLAIFETRSADGELSFLDWDNQPITW